MIWRIENNSLVCIRHEIINDEICYFEHRIVFDPEKVEACDKCHKGCVFLVNKNENYVVHSFSLDGPREIRQQAESVKGLETRIIETAVSSGQLQDYCTKKFD